LALVLSTLAGNLANLHLHVKICGRLAPEHLASVADPSLSLRLTSPAILLAALANVPLAGRYVSYYGFPGRDSSS